MSTDEEKRLPDLIESFFTSWDAARATDAAMAGVELPQRLCPADCAVRFGAVDSIGQAVGTKREVAFLALAFYLEQFDDGRVTYSKIVGTTRRPDLLPWINLGGLAVHAMLTKRSNPFQALAPIAEQIRNELQSTTQQPLKSEGGAKFVSFQEIKEGKDDNTTLDAVDHAEIELTEDDGRPYQVTGRRLIGWTVCPPGSLHATPELAMESIRRSIPFPIEWVNVIRNPNATPAFYGAHQKMISHLRTFGFFSDVGNDMFTPQEFRAMDLLRDELGTEITSANWHLDPEYQSISEPIENAFWPHEGSHFFAVKSDASWEVRRYDRLAKASIFVSHALSKEDAVVSAGEADYAWRRSLLLNSTPAKSSLRGYIVCAVVLALALAILARLMK